MAKADPLYSAGARYEREAIRNHLQRKVDALYEASNGHVLDPVGEELEKMLNWVKSRQSRYDKKPGGL